LIVNAFHSVFAISDYTVLDREITGNSKRIQIEISMENLFEWLREVSKFAVFVHPARDMP
jgi:hypothetical protein